ncbi:MAG: BspA family leucine-rich repeat surface protein, partial [Urechidicola sp.]|nr:BspA family leucine-rich repeat surface protein [Urechidicola sp.]
DTAGNTTDCSFTVTVNDTEAPVFDSCPTDINQCAQVVTYAEPTVSDNCNVTLVRTSGLASGSTFSEGTTTIIYTATDDAGNTALCSFDVTVGSSTPFFITCPGDTTVSNDSGTCGAIVNYTLPTVEDCFVLTQTNGLPPNSFFPVGSNFVRYRVADPSTGNQTFCDFNIIVEDEEAPTAICQNIILELDSQGLAYLSPSQLNNGSADICASPTSLTYSINGSTDDVQFSCSDIGSTSVDLTVTDPAGNESTCTTNVEVVDNRVPIFVCTEDIIVDIASESAFVTYNIPTASDNCGQPITPIRTQGIESGTEFSLGSTTIVYAATDASNNTSFCSFTVTLIDTANPEFITEWTTNDANETVTIPINSSPGLTYNYSIDWGDGVTENNQTTALTHTYANSGPHIVTISGAYPSIKFTDALQLTKLIQWGNEQWQALDFAFSGCINMEYAAIDVPELLNVSLNPNIGGVFYNCSNLGSPDLNNWNFTGSQVNNLNGFFSGSNFNGDIDLWDVSQINVFDDMFNGTPFNQDISSWTFDAPNTTMRSMFRYSSFNQDISGWDVTNVQYMNWMFLAASEFNQNLANWDVSNVASLTSFLSESGLSRENLDNLLIGWDNLFDAPVAGFLSVGVRNLLYCDGAAAKASLEAKNIRFDDAIQSCDFVTTWQTKASESITIPTLSHVLGEYNYSVDWGDGTAIETSVLGDISHVYSTSEIRTITISGYFPAIYFNNSGDKDKILSVENWGNSAWATLEDAFHGCSNLIIETANDVPFLSSVTSMKSAFEGATSITTGVEKWDVRTVTNMVKLFKNATSFGDNISNWDISSVTDMTELFNGVSLPTSLYDPLLMSWANLTVNTSVDFDAGNSYYCYGANAKLLLEASGWQISDNGSNCSNISFDTEWVTIFDNETIIIGLGDFPNSSFNFIIDWGDGSAIEQHTNSQNPKHQYTFSGNHNVKILGVLPALKLSDAGNGEQNKLINITQWGVNKWSSMNNAFKDCDNLNISAIDAPDLTNVTDLNSMFQRALLDNTYLNHWDVSAITNMQDLFRGSQFNNSLDLWNVSNVQDMSGLFRDTPFNQEIGNWNVGNVTN